MSELEFEFEVALEPQYEGGGVGGGGEIGFAGRARDDIARGQPSDLGEGDAALRVAMNDPELRHEYRRRRLVAFSSGKGRFRWLWAFLAAKGSESGRSAMGLAQITPFFSTLGLRKPAAITKFADGPGGRPQFLV